MTASSLNRNLAQREKPRDDSSREASLLQAALAELSAGQTYVTMAAIAYELGQIERGSSLLAQATATYKYGKDLAARLSGPSRENIEIQLSDLAGTVEQCVRGDSLFAPCLRQPSLS